MQETGLSVTTMSALSKSYFLPTCFVTEQQPSKGYRAGRLRTGAGFPPFRDHFFIMQAGLLPRIGGVEDYRVETPGFVLVFRDTYRES